MVVSRDRGEVGTVSACTGGGRKGRVDGTRGTGGSITVITKRKKHLAHLPLREVADCGRRFFVNS